MPKPYSVRKLTKDSYTPKKPCFHREHKPPSHMVYKPGTYTHKCPACGEETTFTVPLVTW